MKTMELLDMLKVRADLYRKEANESIIRNKHMNKATGSPVPQEDIDALLVDFINFIGIKAGVDLGLYTCDLEA